MEKGLKENEFKLAGEKLVRTDRERASKKMERACISGVQTVTCANVVLSFV